MTYFNRRQFLSRSAMGMTAGAAALSGLGSMNAFAADLTGYKALVCIQLKGGMDHGDTILPKDSASYDALKSIRADMFSAYESDTAGSSRNRNNIQKLEANNSDLQGREFGVGQDLAPLGDLFNAGECAVIGSVGPLIEPTDQRGLEAGTSAVPPRLFSHNDQQSTWMSGGAEGARTGWGGRFAAAVAKADRTADTSFMAVTATEMDVFLAGGVTQQFRAPSGNDGGIRVVDKKWLTGYGSEYDAARDKLAVHFKNTSAAHDNIFRRDVTTNRVEGLGLMDRYFAAKDTLGTFSTEFPNTRLGSQLRSIAESIALRSIFNVRRQVFYASIGGFDTHDSQANELPGRHAELAGALKAFRDAMVEMGQWNNVAAFTMSDFGRTLIANSSGTDHGWGAHHFVLGGAVQGKRIYGPMPDFNGRGDRYTQERARLIPSVSVEQYAATLGNWFGLDSGELNTALPNLSRFDTSDLGFMGLSGA